MPGAARRASGRSSSETFCGIRRPRPWRRGHGDRAASSSSGAGALRSDRAPRSLILCCSIERRRVVLLHASGSLPRHCRAVLIGLDRRLERRGLRSGASRSGWSLGWDAEEARRHPNAGGRPDEPWVKTKMTAARGVSVLRTFGLSSSADGRLRGCLSFVTWSVPPAGAGDGRRSASAVAWPRRSLGRSRISNGYRCPEVIGAGGSRGVVSSVDEGARKVSLVKHRRRGGSGGPS